MEDWTPYGGKCAMMNPYSTGLASDQTLEGRNDLSIIRFTANGTSVFLISLVQGCRASLPVAAEQYRNQSRIRPGEAKSKDLVLARRAPHQRPRVSHFHRSGQARDPFSRRADSSNSFLTSTWKVPRWEVVERRSPIAGFLYGGDSYRRSKWEVRVRALALFRKASA